jgi:hypothetical protein
MKKLLLLDADVIIDLHSLQLFEKLRKSYHLHVTQEVLAEARFYKWRNKKIPINSLMLINFRVILLSEID